MVTSPEILRKGVTIDQSDSNTGTMCSKDILANEATNEMSTDNESIEDGTKYVGKTKRVSFEERSLDITGTMVHIDEYKAFKPKLSKSSNLVRKRVSDIQDHRTYITAKLCEKNKLKNKCVKERKMYRRWSDDSVDLPMSPIGYSSAWSRDRRRASSGVTKDKHPHTEAVNGYQTPIITVTDETEAVTEVTESESHTLPDSSHCLQADKWPHQRSQSVDSRDNPFLPGGELSKEADDLLSKATIIRDTFIIKDNDKQEVTYIPVGSEHTNELSAEGKLPGETEKASDALLTSSKPNGMIESEDSLTPGSVKMELAEENKDKKKQKCCSVM